MKWMMRYILPTAVPMLVDILIMVLTELSKESSSNVDDALVGTLTKERMNISALIMREAQRRL